MVLRIPRGKGKHADKAAESIVDVPLVDGREEHFRIAFAAEDVTQGEQLRAQFPKISKLRRRARLNGVPISPLAAIPSRSD